MFEVFVSFFLRETGCPTISIFIDKSILSSALLNPGGTAGLWHADVYTYELKTMLSLL